MLQISSDVACSSASSVSQQSPCAVWGRHAQTSLGSDLTISKEAVVMLHSDPAIPLPETHLGAVSTCRGGQHRAGCYMSVGSSARGASAAAKCCHSTANQPQRRHSGVLNTAALPKQAASSRPRQTDCTGSLSCTRSAWGWWQEPGGLDLNTMHGQGSKTWAQPVRGRGYQHSCLKNCHSTHENAVPETELPRWKELLFFVLDTKA